MENDAEGELDRRTNTWVREKAGVTNEKDPSEMVGEQKVSYESGSVRCGRRDVWQESSGKMKTRWIDKNYYSR